MAGRNGSLEARRGRLPALSPGIRSMVASAFWFSLMSLAVKLAGEARPRQLKERAEA